jgi:hypothetical protein
VYILELISTNQISNTMDIVVVLLKAFAQIGVILAIGTATAYLTADTHLPADTPEWYGHKLPIGTGNPGNNTPLQQPIRTRNY